MTSAGSRLGCYALLHSLGAGGMGEVFLARDTRLGREVALKVLPERFALDAYRRARFEREARLLGSLSHANIAMLYGLEEADGVQMLALELVEGETLAEKLASLRRKGSRLSQDEALAIAEQVAAALDAAHEQGVVHRDLKPSNIALKPDGTVKVLDFGLAKALERQQEDVGEHPPTVTEIGAPGAALGTPAYMSPEQARGLKVDRRTDIWAFGCVLYEMLAGQRAFAGDTSTEVIARVLERQPAFDAVPAEVPLAVRRLLRRCLEKDPQRRLRDIGDARLELAETQRPDGTELSLAPPAHTPGRRRASGRGVRLTAAAGAIAIAGALARALGWPPTAEPSLPSSSPARFVIDTPGLPNGNGAAHELSPDGSTVVYTAEQAGIVRIYRRRMNELDAQPIPGTEGGGQSFFSPDGRWLGFYADGQLKKVALTGGDPIVICRCQRPAGAAWGPDGTIVLGALPPHGLMQVSSDGGVPIPFAELEDGEANQWGPSFLPNVRAVLFVSNTPGDKEIHRRIVVERTDTHERRVLFNGITPHYVPTGHIVFMRQNSDVLWIVPFDAERLEVTGEASPALAGVRVSAANGTHFAVAQDGTLAYVPGTVHGREARLVWRDKTGRTEPLFDQPQGFPRSPRLSPDGKRLAAYVSPSGENSLNDIWIYDLVGDRPPLKLTVWGGSNLHPVWSPDGTKVAFLSAPWAGATTMNLPNRKVGLFLVPADGSAQSPELLAADGVPQTWSPDGAELVVARDTETSGRDLWVVSVADHAERRLIATRYDENNAALSPNGEWLAYVSDRTGRAEVYVQPYRGGAPTRVSRDGGQQPLWERDGSGVYYQSGGRIMFAQLNISGGGVSVGPPEQAFDGGIVPSGMLYADRTFDVAPDGRLVAIDLGGPTVEHLVVIQQWAQLAARNGAR